MTDADRIAAIRARLAAATPGPWVAEFNTDTHLVYMFQATDTRTTHESHRVWVCEHNLYEPDEDSLPEAIRQFNEAVGNAELIANAPADIAWLLDRPSVVPRGTQAPHTR